MATAFFKTILTNWKRFDIFGLHRLGILGGIARSSAQQGKFMLNPHPSPFTNKILELSNENEWQVAILSEDRVAVPFDEGDGRSQVAYISSVETAGGLQAAFVYSMAAKLSDIEDKLGQDFYNELLDGNANAANYGWSILSGDSGDYLAAGADFVLDSFDAVEFGAAVANVSTVADAMEKRFGLDNF